MYFWFYDKGLYSDITLPQQPCYNKLTPLLHGRLHPVLDDSTQQYQMSPSCTGYQRKVCDAPLPCYYQYF